MFLRLFYASPGWGEHTMGCITKPGNVPWCFLTKWSSSRTNLHLNVLFLFLSVQWLVPSDSHLVVTQMVTQVGELRVQGAGREDWKLHGWWKRWSRLWDKVQQLILKKYLSWWVKNLKQSKQTNHLPKLSVKKGAIFKSPFQTKAQGGKHFGVAPSWVLSAYFWACSA